LKLSGTAAFAAMKRRWRNCALFKRRDKFIVAQMPAPKIQFHCSLFPKILGAKRKKAPFFRTGPSLK
jgi:hypothetical protein